MGEAIGAVGENVDRNVSRNAAFFGQQYTFGKRQHLDGEAQVVAIFIDQRQAVVADMGNLGADVEQQRFNLSKVSFLPPTMTENLPSCRVMTLPETGASTMSAPFSRTLAARARLTVGLTVLMSMKILPALESG